MSLESFPIIAKWAALVLAVLTLLRVPPLLSRWSAARQVYGRIPWSLARQMLWYTRKSPMAFPVKASFLCLPFTTAGGVRQLFFDDPIGYFLLGLASQAYALIRTADVVLPPTVLLLGASTRDATHTLGHLNTFLPNHRTVALLHPRERLPFDVVQAFYFNNLRTANAYEWRSIVFHFMDVVPVIVIDAAADSPAVAEELRRIERHGYNSRAVLVAGGAGGPGGGFAQVERSELPRWISVRLSATAIFPPRKWEPSHSSVTSRLVASALLHEPGLVNDSWAETRLARAKFQQLADDLHKRFDRPGKGGQAMLPGQIAKTNWNLLQQPSGLLDPIIR